MHWCFTHSIENCDEGKKLKGLNRGGFKVPSLLWECLACLRLSRWLESCYSGELLVLNELTFLRGLSYSSALSSSIAFLRSKCPSVPFSFFYFPCLSSVSFETLACYRASLFFLSDEPFYWKPWSRNTRLTLLDFVLTLLETTVAPPESSQLWLVTMT